MIMSEWDNILTPYQCLVKNEHEHSFLTFLSLCCLIEGRLLSPIEIIENEKFAPIVEEMINRTTITDFIRTVL